jgi:H+/gluconate symporter-like permease
MKKAELAAQQSLIAAEDAPHSATTAQDTHSADDFAVQSFDEEFEQSNRKTGKLHNFLLPMIMLVGFTIWFEIDVWKGLLMTFLLTLPLYLVQRLMNISEMMDVMIHGFKTMLPAICTVIAAFVFKDVCDQLGLPQFIIDNLAPYMSAQMLPALVFLSMAVATRLVARICSHGRRSSLLRHLLW